MLSTHGVTATPYTNLAVLAFDLSTSKLVGYLHVTWADAVVSFPFVGWTNSDIILDMKLKLMNKWSTMYEAYICNCSVMLFCMIYFYFVILWIVNCVFAVADDLQPVLFEESLVTFSDINHEVGKFSVSICSTEHECIEVKSSSSGVIDGVPCGSVLSACLSRTGQTLEQNHFQYVKVGNKLIHCISWCITAMLPHWCLHNGLFTASVFRAMIWNGMAAVVDNALIIIVTSGQINFTTGHIAAAHGRFSGIRQVTPVCTVHLHLIHASLGPLESKYQTASRLVQPFVHSSWQRVAILFNGPPLFSLKISPSHWDLDPS